MEEHAPSDHLANSLTDLMTSLMVIFILLLLAFISHAAHKDATVSDVLLKKLKDELKITGIDSNKVKRDPRDPDAILVIVPDNLMNFETQKADLKPAGSQWLDTNIPRFAAALCEDHVAPNVQSIVVEGHTDIHGYAGKTESQNESLNMRLSQERSMTVVQEALHSLEGNRLMQSCFLDKLSAVGRGQRDPEPTDDASRRVIFRIRVKASDEQILQKAM